MMRSFNALTTKKERYSIEGEMIINLMERKKPYPFIQKRT